MSAPTSSTVFGLIVITSLAGCYMPGPDSPLTLRRPRRHSTASAPPLDIGPIVHADHQLPPVSGGTLVTLQTEGGSLAVASDPDRDRLYIVSVPAAGGGSLSMLHDLALLPGDEPGRVVGDAGGRAHVVLRGAGAVATVELASGRIVDRRAVCLEPRGIAYDASGDVLHVACAGGELVTLAASGGPIMRTRTLQRDLRDVTVVGERLFVSTFRSAHLLVLNAEETVERDVSPPTILADRGTSVVTSDTFEPEIAWRTTATPDGHVVMVHQRAQVDPVVPTAAAPVEYYGAEDCRGGVVHAALMTVDGNESTPIPHASVPITLPVLPVDVAVSPDGRRFAIASAANAGVVLVEAEHASLPRQGSTSGCDAPQQLVATPERRLPSRTRTAVSSSRRPVSPRRSMIDAAGTTIATLSLSGVSVADTGHDSSTWMRAPASRARRATRRASTTATSGSSRHRRAPDAGRLRGGVLDTMPLHWSGDIRSFGMLMDEVFVTRMGGARPQPEHMSALSRYIDAVPALRTSRTADATAVERGRRSSRPPRSAARAATPARSSRTTQTRRRRHRRAAPGSVAVGSRSARRSSTTAARRRCVIASARLRRRRSPRAYFAPHERAARRPGELPRVALSGRSAARSTRVIRHGRACGNEVHVGRAGGRDRSDHGCARARRRDAGGARAAAIGLDARRCAGERRPPGVRARGADAHRRARLPRDRRCAPSHRGRPSPARRGVGLAVLPVQRDGRRDDRARAARERAPHAARIDGWRLGARGAGRGRGRHPALDVRQDRRGAAGGAGRRTSGAARRRARARGAPLPREAGVLRAPARARHRADVQRGLREVPAGGAAPRPAHRGR